MAWLLEHALLLGLFAVYTLLLVHHARTGQKKSHTVADFFVGGRSVGGATLGISFFATYASTNSYIGFSGKSYSYGPSWLIIIAFAVVFCVMAWTLVAPRLRTITEQLSSVTIPDFIGFRFQSPAARLGAAIIVLFSSLLYMTAVFKGIGTLLQRFLDLPYSTSIFVVLVVVVLYTMAGGFHSVVRTDVVQGLLMAIAAGVMSWGISRAAGGPLRLFESPAETASFAESAIAFPLLVGTAFASTVKLIVEPRQLSRFYALESPEAARTGLWVSTSCFLVIFSLLAPLGLFARHILEAPVADSDQVIPMLLSDPALFGPLAQAFLFLALASAAMSSLDSVLLVVASTAHRDIVEVAVPSLARHALPLTRVYIFLFAMLTAILALDPPGGIVELTSFSGALYAACFAPALFFGLQREHASGAPVLASFAVGIGTLWLWPRFGYSLHAVFPAIALSVLAFWVVRRLGPGDRAIAA